MSTVEEYILNFLQLRIMKIYLFDLYWFQYLITFAILVNHGKIALINLMPKTRPNTLSVPASLLTGWSVWRLL